MFNTLTITKIVAAFCVALLVYALGGWIVDKMLACGHHAMHKVAWIDTSESTDSGDTETGADAGLALADLMAAADIEKGRKVFKKCKACHKVEDGVNGIGPHLYAIVGRSVGAVDNFSYSGALGAVVSEWSEENLNAFLTKPKKFAPGTIMSFNGLSKPADRANVIAYLATIGN